MYFKKASVYSIYSLLKYFIKTSANQNKLNSNTDSDVLKIKHLQVLKYFRIEIFFRVLLIYLLLNKYKGFMLQF